MQDLLVYLEMQLKYQSFRHLSSDPQQMIALQRYFHGVYSISPILSNVFDQLIFAFPHPII